MEKSIGFLCFLFLVKCRVICVKVLVIQCVLNYAHTVAEALEVDDLAFTQKAYGVGNVAVIAKAQDVVVGKPCFLFCCELIRRTRCEKPLKTLGFSLAQGFCRYAFVKTTFKNSSEFQWVHLWFL